MPSTPGRAVAATLLVLATAASARAEHFNRIGFVPAWRPCAIASANVFTTSGVAACRPAVAVSDCKASPGTALKLSDHGRASIIYRASGRRETHEAGGVDFLVSFAARGVLDCDGNRYTGDIRLRFTMSQDRRDPACESGLCSLPSQDLVATIPCEDGDCRRAFSASELGEGASLGMFPQHSPFAIKFHGLDVLDLDGRPFLTEGVAFNSVPAAAPPPPARGVGWWLSRLVGEFLSPAPALAYLNTAPQYAHAVLTRFTQAYVRCEKAATNTATGDGTAACVSQAVSDCESDPDHALWIELKTALDTLTGRAKVHLHIDDDEYEIRGNVAGLKNCYGTPFSGDLAMEWRGSVTLDDPACGPDLCTTVPALFFARTLEVREGESVFKADGMLADVGRFPGEANWAIVSDIRASVLDPVGRAALSGPATLVRCSPLLDANGQPFCYSN